MDIPALLAAHDAQVRRSLSTAPGFVAEDTGRVVRVTAPPGSDRSYVEWSDLDESTADAEIDAQLTHFAGRPFEWKTYGRDSPVDLGDRLVRRGFVAGEPEAFVVGEVGDVLAATDGHDSLAVIRPATGADLPAIAAMNATVWDHGTTPVLTELFAERSADPARLAILLAEVGGEVAGAGWVRLTADADFASLWGGATRPAWRGRGIYRALVRRRALLARTAGHRWLQVDCTPASRPILERLGLQTLDTTTPYRWRP